MGLSDLKVDQQCCKAGSEASRKLGLIKRGFKNKTRAVMLALNKAMVRPHSDYYIIILHSGIEASSVKKHQLVGKGTEESHTNF